MKKSMLLYLIIVASPYLVSGVVVGNNFSSTISQQSVEDKMNAEKRESQRVEERREEAQRVEDQIQARRREDLRVEQQRLDDQRYQRRQDDKAWDRQHGR